MINSPATPNDLPPAGGGAADATPRCRCTPEEVERGHRHRCPAGPPAYRAVGRWKGMTPEQIEAELRPESPGAGPGEADAAEK